MYDMHIFFRDSLLHKELLNFPKLGFLLAPPLCPIEDQLYLYNCTNPLFPSMLQFCCAVKRQKTKILKY